MTKTDHLARAKDYIAIAESGDAKNEAYRRAADAIVASGATQTEAATAIGRDQSWVQRLLKWQRDYAEPHNAPPPFGGPDESKARYQRQAREALRDPERRRRAMAELDDADLDDIRDEAMQTTVERARTRQREQATEPTVRELGGEGVDLSQEWADQPILTVAAAAAKLAARVASGLILGSLPQERALEYLETAERQVAEARAAVQEQIRDKELV